jgi:hypothetical protein
VNYFPGIGTWKSCFLKKQKLSITAQRRGAIIPNLHLRVNDTNWMESESKAWDGMYAHFLCFARWGAVSEEEKQRGITYHGEAVQQNWQRQAGGVRSETLAVTLPIIGLNAQRTVLLAEKGSAFRITDIFTNPTGRRLPYNVVEYVTLSEFAYAASARVSTNADRGILLHQGKQVKNSAFRWPFLSFEKHQRNARRWLHIEGISIVSMEVPDKDKRGWVCVVNPSQREILGYIWPTAELPWLLMWSYYENGRIQGCSFEPGTSGLNHPLGKLEEIGTILNRPFLCHFGTCGGENPPHVGICLQAASRSERGEGHLCRRRIDPGRIQGPWFVVIAVDAMKSILGIRGCAHSS